jgi:hypothetical protein
MVLAVNLVNPVEPLVDIVSLLLLLFLVEYLLLCFLILIFVAAIPRTLPAIEIIKLTDQLFPVSH